jgi:hypothetical protein
MIEAPMTSSDDDGPAGRDSFAVTPSAVTPSAVTPPAATPQATTPAAGPATAGPHAHRAGKFAPSRHRPWWKWALISLLLLFSLAVTVLYATVLVGDLSQHHWTAALDDSRDAVPALVGWAALLILFVSGGSVAGERMLSADSYARNESQRKAGQAEESVRSAERRVAKLTARLSELAAARAAAPGAASGLERQIAHTSARLDKARQWLAGAKSALESAQQEVTETERELARDFPGPMAGPGAGAGRPA